MLGVDELERLQRALAGAHELGVRALVTTALLRPHLRKHVRSFGLRIEALAIEEIPLDTYRVNTVVTLQPD
jgi:type III secretion protein V